jgi:hypothetical protein
MKVAVLLTGALRTIRKTIKYFKKNVILTPDVDVFACVQHDSADMTISEWEKWFEEQIGTHLKYLEWFSLDRHPEWVIQRDTLINHISIPNNWKNYIRSSGSMIEYAQLQYAYFKMAAYEQSHNFKYNYIVKSRTDTIYAKPVDFHWLNWTDSQVGFRLENILEEMKYDGIEINDSNIIKYFMTTIFSDDLILNIKDMISEMIESRDGSIPKPNPTELNEYIKNGSYILTIRANNVYIVRRDLFNLIPALGTMYGMLHYPQEDEYWFNAENQFRAACYNSNLTIYNYDNSFEAKSLYSYNEANYFTSTFELKQPRMMYCVVRY